MQMQKLLSPLAFKVGTCMMYVLFLLVMQNVAFFSFLILNGLDLYNIYIWSDNFYDFVKVLLTLETGSSHSPLSG